MVEAPPEDEDGIPAPPPWPDDGRALWEAPAAYDHLILKVSYPFEQQYKNLRYEGHNGLLMTGAADGEEAATRWRRLVSGTRGVFLLRDSIWSQQDHPYLKLPYALMMPPSWVTAAMDDVSRSRAIAPPQAPPSRDDAAWGAIATPAALFGSFPASDSLHREAILPLTTGDAAQRDRTRAARASLASLRADVQAMIDAAPRGVDAVAAAGAERIARSDALYFGRALRFHRVVPIFVENPNTKELAEEGKGMTPLGRPAVDAALIVKARDAVYRRRLRDGDLAIERYDLSQPSERKRAIAVLEALIPASGGEPGGTLWLWVTGKLDPLRKAEGENATRYLAAFDELLKAASIDRARLRVLSKPATELPEGEERKRIFTSDVKWYRHRDLPYAVNLSTGGLSELIR